MTKARDLADNTQNTKPKVVDAKGDLIAATAADTANRLAVGNNGENLVVDSSTSTGLRWQGSMAAGKNALINGGFDFWQRGTTFTPNDSTFTNTADKWYSVRSAGSTNFTITQSTLMPTGLNGFSCRLQRTAGDTSTATNYLIQALENQSSTPFTGRTVTLSFWARAGANYSGGAATAVVTTGTGTNQVGYPTGWTGTANAIASAFTPTTSWVRYSFTGTTSSTATQIATWFYYSTTGTAGADDSLYITGVQLEIGSVATTFTRAGGVQSLELVASGSPTNGQVLTADSTVLGGAKWATSSSGGWTSLATGNLSGTETIVNITTTGYKQVVIFLKDVVCTTDWYWQLRINGDSFANYSSTELVSTGASAANAYTQGGVTNYSVQPVEATDYNCFGQWTIYDPANTNTVKQVVGNFSHVDNTAAFRRNASLTGQWFGTPAAVTSVTFIPASTFSSGTYEIYGVK